MVQWLIEMKWLLIFEHTNKCEVALYVVVVNINDAIMVNRNEVIIYLNTTNVKLYVAMVN